MLFYDPAAGVSEFYTTEGGNLALLSSHSGWRTSWSVIAPCNLTGGAHHDLLFYDPSQGVGEYHRVSDAGDPSLLSRHTDWRHTWSVIAPGTYS